MRIGVDVGGTNTDAVLMDGKRVVASTKTATTEDVGSGIATAIAHVLRAGKVTPDSLFAVMIGTTHFTNAFVERRRLARVGVIRLGYPASTAIPPLYGWPDALLAEVGAPSYIVGGGYEYNGTLIAPFDESAVANAARNFRRDGLRAVAVSCVFAPVNSEQEHRAAHIIKNEHPDAVVSLSSQFGRLGLIERENAAVMNASLLELAAHVISSFKTALQGLNIIAPLYITQNDGTLMTAQYAALHPVMTFASGPTNSMRGAAFLTRAQDAVVIDIGGTTTDIGFLRNGFPRESAMNSDIGGVRTNFRMPDVVSVGLGGGSLVRDDGNMTIGPQSVGYEILNKALVFGGTVLTATDIAVAAGLADIGDRGRVKNLDSALVNQSLALIQSLIARGIERVKVSAADVPAILVGGGSILVSGAIKGVSEFSRPENYAVANAIGAAIAQAGGEVDRYYSYDQVGRDAALQSAKDAAIQRALEAGAVPGTVSIVDTQEYPLAYLDGGTTRVRVKAVGEMGFFSDLGS